MASTNSRQGAYGALYRYIVHYRDLDPGCPVFTQYYWAYDYEHAKEQFLNDGDNGWLILSITKERDTQAYRSY